MSSIKIHNISNVLYAVLSHDNKPYNSINRWKKPDLGQSDFIFHAFCERQSKFSVHKTNEKNRAERSAQGSNAHLHARASSHVLSGWSAHHSPLCFILQG